MKNKNQRTRTEPIDPATSCDLLQGVAAIVSHLSEGIIMTDHAGLVVEINPAASALTGYASDDACGKPVQEIMELISEEGSPDDMTPSHQEYVLQSRLGIRYPVTVERQPVTWCGQTYHMILIRYLQELDAAVRLTGTYQEYERIFNGSQTPLFLVDVASDGTFRYRRFNRANAAYVGLSSREIIGRTPHEIFGADMGNRIHERFAACVQSQTPLNYVAEREFPTGYRIQSVHLSPVILDGQVVQIIGSVFDLTEQITMERALRDSEERFRSLFDNLTDMACVYNFDPEGVSGPLVEVNRTMRESLGYTRDELLSLNPADLDDPSAFAQYGHIKQQLMQGKEAEYTLRIRRRDGSVIPVEIHSRLISYKGRDSVLSTMRDVTERLAWEARIEHHLKIEKAISEVLSIFVSQDDVDFNLVSEILGEAVDCSTSFIYLYDGQEVYATKISQWIAPGTENRLPVGRQTDTREMSWYYGVLKSAGILVYHDVTEFPEAAAAEREDMIRGGIRAILNVAFFTKDGAMRGFLGFTDQTKPRVWREEDISLLRSVAETIGVYFDRKAADEKIRYISFHDNITGLYNRGYFEEELLRLDAPRQLPLSILVGDVNGLKLVNDAFGHAQGDRFLKQVADSFRTVCRKEDIVARWGGDEFIVLLPRTTEQEAELLADRIRRNQEDQYAEPIRISMSMGVATKEDPHQRIDLVIRDAEDRMYRNKLLESHSYRSAVIALLEKTLWERSNETEAHTRRMQMLAVRLGKAIGLSDSKLDEVRLLTSLHDIGKIAIPDTILNKPGPLTADEWVIMRRHTEIGYRIANASYELAPIAGAILAHHERWDGGGYPQGLRGAGIPITARLVAIVDALRCHAP